MKTFKQLKEELDSLYFSEEEILAILSDESIDEEVRKEIFDHFFQEADVDWDAVGKGVAQGVSFGYAPQIKAKAKSLWKGTDYEKELEKEKSEYEKAQERSPKSFAAGEYGSMLIPAGGAVLGAAKAAKMAKGAVTGARAARQASKAAKASKEVGAAQKALSAAEEAAAKAKTGKNISNVAKAEEKVVSAASKQNASLNKMKTLMQKQRNIKATSVLKPTKGKVLATVAGAAAIAANKAGVSTPSVDDVKSGVSDAYDKAKDAVSSAADKAKEKQSPSTNQQAPTTPITGQGEKKATEPNDLEKRIKQLNVQRADIAKKGVGVGDPTKTASERGMSGDAAQKYNQFVAARDEKLKQDLVKIANK
jgi:hypothetical protein